MAAVGLSGSLGAETGPVLVFDVSPTGAAEVPLLEVMADGTAVVRMPDGTAAAAAVGPARLDRLRRFLEEETGIADLDGAEIEAAIAERTQAAGRVFQTADAPVTRIALRTGGAWEEVAFHGTALAALAFPDIEALARLRQAELRLLDLVEELRGR
jgi:hypothetical protein